LIVVEPSELPAAGSARYRSRKSIVALQLLSSVHMVVMLMGQQDQAHPKIQLLRRSNDRRRITARIEHHRLATLGIPS
jgi:hypothetical protein